MRTVEQVRKEWASKGITIAGWAREHGYSAENVRDVLRGKSIGRNGSAHEIMVRLGLKEGLIGVPAEDYSGQVRGRLRRA